MKKSLIAYGATAAALLLAGCETTSDQGSGVQRGVAVTRIHLGQPIARGEIRVEPADPALASRPEFAQHSAAVERELSRLGWTVTQGNARSEQVATVRVNQSSRESASRRAGPIAITELHVAIRRRSEGSMIWEGRAQLEARTGAPLAQPGAAVDRLAAALFQDFPGESNRTIRVR